MPALPPYISRKDADFNNWLLNFSTLITADHEYMVPGRPTG